MLKKNGRGFAFDNVVHKRLVYKLERYGFVSQPSAWIENFLNLVANVSRYPTRDMRSGAEIWGFYFMTNKTQSTFVNGIQSKECSASSGVPPPPPPPQPRNRTWPYLISFYNGGSRVPDSPVCCDAILYLELKSEIFPCK